MELELIKNKVYCKIFDKTYKASSGIYSLHKYCDAAKLTEVATNISAIREDLKAKEILILKQVHGNHVVHAEQVNMLEQPEADASTSSCQGIALSVLTADCVPVLLASVKGDIIGAAHCGWKGTKLNIIHQVKMKMHERGAKDIKAIIGPAIQQQSYEVSSEYRESFLTENPSYDELFLPSKKQEYFMFDLVGLVIRKLKAEQIQVEHVIQHDTYSMPEQYPSYRRAYHQGKQSAETNILSTIIMR